MRRAGAYARSLLASLAAGGIVLQVIVERVRADETFILAYAWIFIGAWLALLAFAAADLASELTRWLDRVAIGLAALAVGAAVALLAMSPSAPAAARTRDQALVLALAAPTLVILLVQWWLLRRAKRNRAAALAKP